MTLEDLKQNYLNSSISGRQTKYFAKKLFMTELWEKTSFLKDENIIKKDQEFEIRLYLYLHSLEDIPRCPRCNHPRLFKRFKDGFYKTCGSKECLSKKQTELQSGKDIGYENKKKSIIEAENNPSFILDDDSAYNLFSCGNKGVPQKLCEWLPNGRIKDWIDNRYKDSEST